MKPYTHILFDLDGTLTDPKVGITKSVQYALAKLGVVEPDAGKLTPFIGPPLHESFERFYGFDAQTARQAVAFYREYFKDRGIYENAVFDGIPELLGALRSHGKSLMVATSKPTVFSEQILRHFALDSFFDHVVGSHLDGTRTVKAEVIAAVLQECSGVPIEAFVMIGDREHDIIGANHHGIDSIGVTYGYGDHAEIADAGPTYIADSVPRLQDILLN